MNEIKMELSEDGLIGKVFIYGEICKWPYEEFDEESATSFKTKLDDIKNAKTVYVHINSNGGSVSEGFAIYSQIQQLPQKTIAVIDGFACSVASIIAMACDEIHMSETSMMMIHGPSTYASGNQQDFEEISKVLEKLLEPAINAYMNKFNLGEQTLREMLKKDTWFTPEECLENGFCNRILRNEASQSLEVEQVVKLVSENKLLNLRINDLLSKLNNSKTTKQLINEYFGG